MTPETLSLFRLKLSPDERRSQQTSIVSGSGTVLIDQQFLFQVRKRSLQENLQTSCRFLVLNWRIGNSPAWFRFTKTGEGRIFVGSIGVSSRKM